MTSPRRRRYAPMMVAMALLALVPYILVASGAVLYLFSAYTSRASLYAAVGLLGIGAGPTVTPELFLAGLSLQTRYIGRIMALVELCVRSPISSWRR